MIIRIKLSPKGMKFILGTKDGMTQVFTEDGVCHPATVVRVSPQTVTQIRTVDKDGYMAAQVATEADKEQRHNKAEKGHFGQAFKHVREFRLSPAETELGKGQVLKAGVFAVGDKVAVSAVSKGKGFQGVVKRHGFKGGRKSHGQKHSLREPGSIGGGGRSGGRVVKGMRMAGRMGGDRVTVKNLKVLQVNPEANLVLVSGAIPGRRGTLVEIRGI